MITLLSQPEDLCFTGNPVQFAFKTDNLVANEGKPFVGYLFFVNAQMRAGFDFTLKYAGLELKFTFADEPDDSGYQLTAGRFGSGALELITPGDVWFPLVANELLSNYLLSRDFDIVAEPTNQRIKFTSKVADPLYVLSLATASADVGTYFLLHVSQNASFTAYNPNFKIFIELWAKRFNQDKFYKVSEYGHDVDDNGESIYDCSDLLSTVVTEDKYDRPSLAAALFELGNKNICEYYIRYGEMYGSPQKVRKMHITDTKIAVLGGFSKPQIGTDLFTFLHNPNNKVRFLKQFAGTIFVKPKQKDFLYWLNLTDKTSAAVSVTVTFEDNSTSTFIPHTFTNLKYCSRLIIPTGMLDLHVDLQDPVKIPRQYSIVLKNGSTELSETVTYQIDYQAQQYVQFYLNLNSWGGYDGRFTYGKKSREFEVLQDSARRPQLGAFNFTQGEQVYYSITSQHKETVATGYKSRLELIGWEDFFLSQDKFCIKNGRLYPIALASKNIKQWTDGDNLKAYEFDIAHNYSDQFFSLDDHPEEEITIQSVYGWVPAVSNPNPDNYDDRYYLKALVYNRLQIDNFLSAQQTSISNLSASVVQQLASMGLLISDKADIGHTHSDYLTEQQVRDLMTGSASAFIGSWSEDTDQLGLYGTGLFVENDGTLYKSEIDNNFTVPGTDNTAWKPIGGAIYQISGGDASGSGFHPSQQ